MNLVDKKHYYLPKIATDYIRLAAKELTPVDFKVLLVLHSLAGWQDRVIVSGQKKISEMANLHITTVCKSLQKLWGQKYIEDTYIYGELNERQGKLYRNRWKNYKLLRHNEKENMFL